MKTLLLVALTAAIANAVNVYDLVLDEWNLYKTTLRRNFRSFDEEYSRLRHFLRSKDLVARHNARYAKGLENYRLSLNHFADWEPFRHADRMNATLRYMEERAQARHGPGSHIVVPPGAIIPDSVDWRAVGAVSPEVIDQKSCGSCYAISGASVLEALIYIKYQKHGRLSPQQIVDCSIGFGNFGCSGGTFSNTFHYMTTTGLLPFDEYPYENTFNALCKVASNHFSKKLDRYYYMFDGDEDKLKFAVATYGPMAVGINVSPRTFQFYSGGIYDDPACGNVLVHAVVLVGYGTDPVTKQDYWIIKNSWGPYWGEEGFMRMARKKGMCGLGTLAYAGAL